MGATGIKEIAATVTAANALVTQECIEFLLLEYESHVLRAE
jgi:hypothetical protein